MTDIGKLRSIIARPEHAGKTPDEILKSLNGPIPEPAEPKTLADIEGVGGLTRDDIEAALEPKVMPPQMRSPDGAPGSWRVEPAGDKFKLWWDNGLQPTQLFKSVEAAATWQEKWFIDNPAVPV